MISTTPMWAVKLSNSCSQLCMENDDLMFFVIDPLIYLFNFTPAPVKNRPNTQIPPNPAPFVIKR